VPLSCVPPITSFESDGLIATCRTGACCSASVDVFDQRRHPRQQSLARLVAPDVTGSGAPPLRNGESHCDETSANDPLVRIIPPSEPSKIWVGLAGLIAIACWSGWIPFGAFRHPWRSTARTRTCPEWLIVASYDRSVNVAHVVCRGGGAGFRRLQRAGKI